MIQITKIVGRPNDGQNILKLPALIENACFRDPWGMDSIADTLTMQNTSLYLIEKEGRPISYCLFSSVLDEAELLRIAVLPEERRRGFADLMFKMLFAEWSVRGIRKIFLEVRRSNVPASALYEKNGFQPVFIRENYYGDGEDAVVYVCEPNDKE